MFLICSTIGCAMLMGSAFTSISSRQYIPYNEAHDDG